MTAVGIWAYSSCPKIRSIAPYFRHIFNTAAMEKTIEIWERKLLIPSVRIRPISRPSGAKEDFSGRTVFILKR